jgi:hypothetical protein
VLSSFLQFTDCQCAQNRFAECCVAANKTSAVSLFYVCKLEQAEKLLDAKEHGITIKLAIQGTLVSSKTALKHTQLTRL